METTRRALLNDTSVVVMLYMALELSGEVRSGRWGSANARPAEHTLKAADVLGRLRIIREGQEALWGEAVRAQVMSCYEAGRDGLLAAPLLLEQGIE